MITTRISCATLLVLGLASCSGEADFSGAIETGTLDSEAYKQEILEIDRLVFEATEMDDTRREALEARLEKLATRVASQCSSACTLAFAGGVRRTVAAGGALGFHAGSAATGIGDGNREFNAYMLYRGIDPQFLLASNAVPPKDIWVPDLQTLKTAGIVTE